MPHGAGTVLVVDDEPNILRVVGKHLESLGYTPILVGNGYDAVRELAYTSDPIDLIILDMIMPELSGRETLQKIREIDLFVPVMVASGFSDGEDRSSVEQLGVSGFLHKPFKKAELAEMVRKLIVNK